MSSPQTESTKRTGAEEKLWQTLANGTTGTTAELSLAAGIGKSTAQKFLSKWEAQGTANRISSGDHRAADRWEAAAEATDTEATDTEATDTEATDTEATDTEATDTEATDTEATDTEATPRLSPGALRGLVDDHLRDHPGEEFGPAVIGKALGRSSGAVNDLSGSSGDGEVSADALDLPELNAVLADLEAEGRVVRIDADGGARWRSGESPGTRLPQGGLQGLVEDYLTGHPGEEFGPNAIGTALGRSSGAVANALVRLTARGVAVQTRERPKRYSAATPS